MGTYELERKIQLYIEKNEMIRPGDHVLVGVSGGADSVCLLFVLHELSRKMGFSISVLHVNHGVRVEAAEDAAYVKSLCEKIEIPFYLEKVDMIAYAKEHKLSEEEAGRLLRYDLFAKYMDKLHCEHVAVAHHGNDRAETMLFNLFRGTGIQGLTSIRPVREDIIRPLLCLDRKEIEEYLKEKKVSYCEDKTNFSDAYTRNKIRHHIIDYAKEEICDQLVAHMNDTAEQLSEIQDYLAKETQKAYDKCVREQDGEIKIAIPVFTAYDIVLQKRILLLCLEQMTPHRKDITSAHIKGILNLLESQKTAAIQLPYQLEARKQYDSLYLCQRKESQGERRREIVILDKEDCPDDMANGSSLSDIYLEDLGFLTYELITDAEKVSHLRDNIPKNQYTKCFDYDKISSAVVVRTRLVGDYILCDSKMHKKSIKEYMINEKIPSHERDLKWLLAEGNHVLWIPGYRISEYYKIDKNTKRILKVQIQEENNAGSSR